MTTAHTRRRAASQPTSYAFDWTWNAGLGNTPTNHNSLNLAFGGSYYYLNTGNDNATGGFFVSEHVQANSQNDYTVTAAVNTGGGVAMYPAIGTYFDPVT